MNLDPSLPSQERLFASSGTIRLPADPSVARPTSMEEIFELTPAKIQRAEKIFKDNGRVPGLLSKVGGGGGSKKKGGKKKKKR